MVKLSEAAADEIYRAAIKWCGQKDRETFPEDVAYFQHNWTALAGLRSFVEAEVAGRTALQDGPSPKGGE